MAVAIGILRADEGHILRDAVVRHLTYLRHVGDDDVGQILVEQRTRQRSDAREIPFGGQVELIGLDGAQIGVRIATARIQPERGDAVRDLKLRGVLKLFEAGPRQAPSNRRSARSVSGSARPSN